MNNYLPGGQVLGAAISILPATGAAFLLPNFQSEGLAVSVLFFAGLWAVSYAGTNIVMRLVKR